MDEKSLTDIPHFSEESIQKILTVDIEFAYWLSIYHALVARACYENRTEGFQRLKEILQPLEQAALAHYHEFPEHDTTSYILGCVEALNWIIMTGLDYSLSQYEIDQLQGAAGQVLKGFAKAREGDPKKVIKALGKELSLKPGEFGKMLSWLKAQRMLDPGTEPYNTMQLTEKGKRALELITKNTQAP